MRHLLLLASLVSLPAAGPQQGLTLQVPANPLTPISPRQAVTPPKPSASLQPAPLPNRDLEDQPAVPSSLEPSLRPSLFTRSDTYRGEGFSRGSTASSDQDKRVKPGVGFNLKMPFSPN